MVNNKKTHNHSISTAKTTYPVGPTMAIGIIPTLLILSAIAILSSVSTAELVYSQGPPPLRQQQQQDLNDSTFQTANVTIDGMVIQ